MLPVLAWGSAMEPQNIQAERGSQARTARHAGSQRTGVFGMEADMAIVRRHISPTPHKKKNFLAGQVRVERKVYQLLCRTCVALHASQVRQWSQRTQHTVGDARAPYGTGDTRVRPSCEASGLRASLMAGPARGLCDP